MTRRTVYAAGLALTLACKQHSPMDKKAVLSLTHGRHRHDHCQHLDAALGQL